VLINIFKDVVYSINMFQLKYQLKILFNKFTKIIVNGINSRRMWHMVELHGWHEWDSEHGIEWGGDDDNHRNI